MKLKQHIPNTITCCNLFSGCLSILFLCLGMPVKAAIMILVAGLFDFLDGLAARVFHAHSTIGADLDSLSDVVSFGVAPGFIMYFLMGETIDPYFAYVWKFPVTWAYLAFLLPVFSAVRLAKFNNDESQITSFQGLPTPAMAIFVASLPLALGQMGRVLDGVLNFWVCLGITLIFSFMMVSRLRFFSFKMKSFSWKGNELQWIFLIVAVAAFAVFRFLALPFILLLYILMSVLFQR
ncbi:MAG: CDP-alcohol phosphatidyltransferase family protein [Bacteroidales bacterium]|nr:CDP-alcohol phosphatidyltransferase family protein [Bacteroidales bacterium]